MFYLGEAWGGYFLFFWCSFSHGRDSNRVTFLAFLCPITYFPQGENNSLKLLVILQWKPGDFSHFSFLLGARCFQDIRICFASVSSHPKHEGVAPKPGSPVAKSIEFSGSVLNSPPSFSYEPPSAMSVLSVTLLSSFVLYLRCSELR